MLTSQRKTHILDTLKRDGQIVAKTFAQQLGLSEDTIRRDLRELAADGRLQRVHGGALPSSPAIANFAARKSISPGPKAAIGRAAAALVRSGQVVFLDGGTTTAQLVRHLPLDLRATVVTHSPSIAIELVDHAQIEVILIGGRLFPHSVVTVGASTQEAVCRIQADVFFLGVTGVHPVRGLTTGDFEEARIKAAIIATAAETIVLASNEKLNAVSPYVIAPLADASGIVLDAEAAPEFIAQCQNLGLAVTLAASDPH